MIINKIENIYKEKLNDDLCKLSSELNLIFKNSNDVITESIIKNSKLKPRTRKLTFIDSLCYYFNYSFIDNTKLSVVSNYNFNNDIEVHMSNYHKKEALIPLSFYDDTFLKIKTLFDKYNNNNNNKIISVDGTYNNTNIKNDKTLETSLNMGYYDVTNKIPIDVQFKGQENKNKEIDSFINYINNNNFDVNNAIFVFDRAYFSYDFINYLNDKKINYVIRVKNNCLYLDKNKTDDVNIKTHDINIKTDDVNIKKTKNKKIINNNENIRFITYLDKCIITKKIKIIMM